MRPYQFGGLLVVTAAVAVVIGVKVGEGRRAERAASPLASRAGGPQDPCCSPAPQSGANVGEPPAVPTGSGLPCLVEFGADECEACQKMEGVLEELRTVAEGKVDVVTINTDRYPQEAVRWRLRLIPTQIVVNAQGEEMARHEGYLPLEELLTELEGAGIQVD